MRWSARVVGLLACGLFLQFIIESGAKLPALSWGSLQGMPLLLALVTAVAGVLVAWRWEAIGGAMALVGSMAVVVMVYLESGPTLIVAAVILTLPLVVAGAVYLGCCWRTRTAVLQQRA
jgi:hypothetical protein